MIIWILKTEEALHNFPNDTRSNSNGSRYNFEILKCTKKLKNHNKKNKKCVYETLKIDIKKVVKFEYR